MFFILQALDGTAIAYFDTEKCLYSRGSNYLKLPVKTMLETAKSVFSSLNLPNPKLSFTSTSAKLGVIVEERITIQSTVI